MEVTAGTYGVGNTSGFIFFPSLYFFNSVFYFKVDVKFKNFSQQGGRSQICPVRLTKKAISSATDKLRLTKQTLPTAVTLEKLCSSFGAGSSVCKNHLNSTKVMVRFPNYSLF